MLSTDQIKEKTGAHAASLVQSGMAVGIGTGSTVYWLIQELGNRTRQGLDITAVPTSKQTAGLLATAGVKLGTLDAIDQLALTIDGADEIDPFGILIKGGGGALLQEKIVAAASARLVIIADESKMVDQLGKFPLPVEVIPFGHCQVMQRIMETGYCREIALRKKDDQVFVTDHGHNILDCSFDKIQDPGLVNRVLKQMTGVVETGLFIGMANEALIGHADGSLQHLHFGKGL